MTTCNACGGNLLKVYKIQDEWICIQCLIKHYSEIHTAVIFTETVPASEYEELKEKFVAYQRKSLDYAKAVASTEVEYIKKWKFWQDKCETVRVLVAGICKACKDASSCGKNPSCNYRSNLNELKDMRNAPGEPDKDQLTLFKMKLIDP